MASKKKRQKQTQARASKAGNRLQHKPDKKTVELVKKALDVHAQKIVSLDRLPASVVTPDDQLVKKERLLDLKKMMRRLTEEERACVRWYFFEQEGPFLPEQIEVKRLVLLNTGSKLRSADAEET